MFRYRGYYYDSETELYYLQSRYYNPEIGRFINADVAEILFETKGEILGANLFAYCSNNPVMNVDSTGYMSATNAANLLNPATIFIMFMALIYANYAYGLATVGGYVLAFISPKVILASWWNPGWLPE